MGVENLELVTVVIIGATGVSATLARTYMAIRTGRIRAETQCEIVGLLQPGSRFTEVNGHTVIVEVGGAMTAARTNQ